MEKRTEHRGRTGWRVSRTLNHYPSPNADRTRAQPSATLSSNHPTTPRVSDACVNVCQQEEAAARMAEADREAEEREARTLTAREEMALRKLIKAKTNQLEAQLTNGVAGDSPLARGLRGEITDARERLQRAGVVLT